MAKTRLVGSTASFNDMIRKFGVVTVMNADVYEFPSNYASTMTPASFVSLGLASANKLCTLDTLKISNITVEGPKKTITGGQYANPLVKFGKTARLEMQDALGNIEAIDALCGGVAEWDGDTTKTYKAIHIGGDFNGPKTIIGDTFFLAENGQQVKVKILIYKFLPDSMFNLVQDAEGDATVFDMNGDLLATDITLPANDGVNTAVDGLFYSILKVENVSNFTLDVSGNTPVAKKDGTAITDGTNYELLWKVGTDNWTSTAPTISTGNVVYCRILTLDGTLVAQLEATKTA